MTNAIASQPTATTAAPRRSALAAIGFAVCTTLLPVGPATAQDSGSLLCTVGNLGRVDGAVCDLPATGRTDITQTTVLDAEGDPVDHVFESPADRGEEAAVLLVFDTSVGANTSQRGSRAPIVAENLASAQALIDRLPETVRIGAGSFDANLTTLSQISTSRAPTEAVLTNGSITADGLNTHLFEASLDAVRKLAEERVDNRIMLVFSDGEPEDAAFMLSEVLEEAQEENVTIIGMASVRANSELSFTQNLERFGEETGGLFFTSPIGSGSFSEAALNQIADFIVGSGTIAIDESDLDDRGVALPLTLTVSYAQGAPEQLELRLPSRLTGSAAQADGGDTAAPSGTRERAGSGIGIFDRVTGGVPLWWIAVGAAVVALIIVLILVFAFRRKKPVREGGGHPAGAQGYPQPGYPQQGYPQGAHGAAPATAAAPGGPATAQAAPATAFASEPATRFDAGPATTAAGGAAGATRPAAPATRPAAAPTRPLQSGDDGATRIRDAGATRPIAPIAVLEKTGSGERTQLFQERVTLGRDAGNDVVFSGGTVSRNHAVLHLGRDGSLRIEDRGSSNGVFVNGQKVTDSPVQPGDRLSLGDEVFTLRRPDQA